MRSSLVLLAALAASVTAQADPIRVVTSIPDHAALVRAIGGDAVEVESIVKGNRDVHAVELLPSFMVKVRQGRRLRQGGHGPRPVVAADHRRLPQRAPGGGGRLREGREARGPRPSRSTPPTATSTSTATPTTGSTPLNARPQGEAILAGLARVRPDLADRFRANLDAYVLRVESSLATWAARLAPYAGVQVVSFHNSWPYFARRFDLAVVDFLEPKPGVPPTPSHVAALQQRLAGGEVKAILMESYFDDRVPEMLSRATGVPVVKVPVLVGAAPGVDDQLALFDAITAALAEALAPRAGGT